MCEVTIAKLNGGLRELAVGGDVLFTNNSKFMLIYLLGSSTREIKQTIRQVGNK
jgi:hypothetical protein